MAQWKGSGRLTVRARNNSEAVDVAGRQERIRYPGVAKLFLIWGVVGALTGARYQLPFGASEPVFDTLVSLLAFTTWFLPWAVLTPIVFRIERKLPLGSSGWPRNLALLAAISVPFCLSAAPAMVALFTAVHGFDAPGWESGSRRWLGPFLSAETMFWCSVATGYFFRTLFQLHEQERRASRLALEKSLLEASLNQAQLETLRARLNPHFLFNSLQNISVLTKQDPETASRSLTVLGDLLRSVLQRDSQPETTLSEEIELTKSYVALEQMRFGDRLRVLFDIAEHTRHAMVPCFLMQPLLENAIIHGLRGVRKTGIIGVRAAPEDGNLVITVTDNGIGPPAERDGLTMGVGLGSTCERLARMYPERHAFSIRKPPRGGAEVRVAIPLRFASPAGPVCGK